jgi:hypothetical protein
MESKPLSIKTAMVYRWRSFKERFANNRIDFHEIFAVFFGGVVGSLLILSAAILGLWGILALIKVVLKTIF